MESFLLSFLNGRIKFCAREFLTDQEKKKLFLKWNPSFINDFMKWSTSFLNGSENFSLYFVLFNIFTDF